jgi:hypothetical protein
MDREFMIQRILVRMTELEQWYKNAVNNKDRNGNPCTPGAAKEIRTHTKRDMQILKLIMMLLDHCSSKMFIDDEEAEAGFDRLVEPVHRKKV